MMREIGYFDLHGDIGYDVLLHKRRGESDVFANRHLKKFQRGNIQIMCMACFFDGHETWEEMQEMVLALKADLAACKEVETVCELPDDHQCRRHVWDQRRCGSEDHMAL